MSHFLTRNGCPALYQEAYDTSAVRTLAKKYGNQNGPDRRISNRMRKHPALYGEAVKLPYLYFPVIIKDVGIRPEEKLPEADFMFLYAGKMVGDRQDCECGEDLKKPWECDPALQSYGEKHV